MIPTSVFALGRMRHLDLLALWHERNPNARVRDQHVLARLSKERLAEALLEHPA